MKTIRTSLLLSAALAVTAAAASADSIPPVTSYTYIAFSVPGAGNTFASGINASGEVVGNVREAGLVEGFLDNGGTFSTLAYLGATYTYANGINASGQIVGSWDNYGVASKAFLYSGGTFTTLPQGWAASGINDQGEIVGQLNGTTSFLDNNGVFTTVAVPGAYATDAYDINDSGEIVGLVQYTPGNPYGGGANVFVYDNGIYTVFNVPGATLSAAYGINNLGQIVGIYATSGGGQLGFLDSGGVFSSLEQVPYGINDSGEITGTLFNGYVGFTAVPTPSPEPSTVMLWGIGAGVLIVLLARSSCPLHGAYMPPSRG